MRVFLAAVVLLTAACNEPPLPPPVTSPPPSIAASTTPSATSIEGLPFAKNGDDLPDDVPTVALDRDHILVDGTVVGDLHALESAGKLQKVDGEFDALKARREAWKAAHPAEPYPGIALLKMPAATKAAVVKSVFQTAAFAGHPTLAFVVQADGKLARINVEAQVPGPPDPSRVTRDPEPEKVLYLGVAPGAPVVLRWRKGAENIAESEVSWAEALARSGEVVRAPALAARLSREWSQQGGHRDPSDKKRDEAMIHTDNAADLAEIVAVLDALYETKREIQLSTGAFRTPVFNATLAMRSLPARDQHTDVPGVVPGVTIVRGRLPPEVIQRVVRLNFRSYRGCYEAGLKKDPKLTGKVTVKFVIGTDGKVTRVADGGSDLGDKTVVACVIKAFSTFSFPPPEGGIVTVTYPIQFVPSDP